MNEYEIAGVVGVCIGGAWIAAYFLSWAYAWAWAWVDDAKAVNLNPLIKYCAFKFGYTIHVNSYGSSFPYKTKGGDIALGAVPFMAIGLAMTFAPLAVVMSFKFYPVAIAIVTFYVIAHLVRYARRHKKVFDEHVADNEAHKG